MRSRFPLPKLLLSALFLAATMLIAAGAQAQGAQRAGGKTLYQRLGGYDAIAAVTHDFVGRLTADPKLARFFRGHSKNSMDRIRQLIVDQLCEATGGPCIYIGRDMVTTHTGLGITEEDWQTAVGHLNASLDKFKVGQQERQELIATVAALKPDIVEK